jgi:hypothetical protein
MEKKNAKLTAEQVAEKERPNWRAVTMPSTNTDAGLMTAKPDARSPELDVLMSKFFGKPRTAAAPERNQDAASEDTTLVVMEPKVAVDLRVGRKASVVKGDRVIAEQG